MDKESDLRVCSRTLQDTFRMSVILNLLQDMELEM